MRQQAKIIWDIAGISFYIVSPIVFWVCYILDQCRGSDKTYSRNIDFISVGIFISLLSWFIALYFWVLNRVIS